MNKERSGIYEEYEALKLKATNGDLYSLIRTIEFVQRNEAGSSEYRIEKLQKVFSQKLKEKNWDDALYILCESSCVFQSPEGEAKQMELKKQLAQALNKEPKGGEERLRGMYGLPEKVEAGKSAQAELTRIFHLCRQKENINAELKYEILRGRDKIGENLIEIAYGDTKILVELGKSLDGGDGQFEQEILNKSYSAVVVSHYHEDHAGLIKCKRDCPVYLGQGAYRIIKAMNDYHGAELPGNITTYRDGKSFGIGVIKVTPYLCDHSAFDSYMLLFEAAGKSILYTGDFRFHGRKDKDKLLSVLPKSVDVLIHEGTNIGKSSRTFSEAELENGAVKIMKSTDGPVFVLQSGTNIDRLVSIYRASKRSGRITYMDNYTSHIASAAGGSIPRPDVFQDVIAFTPRPVYGKRKDMFMEIINKRGMRGIANGTKRFTMLVRPSMSDYMKKLFAAANLKGATLIYSMWSGYKETEYTSEFLTEMQKLGVNIIDLHTSGHASSEDIELLKQTVNAKQTICVHTEKLI